MTITRAEYVALQAKVSAPIREGWRDGVLTVWVPGTPANLKNKVGHWSKRARWAKEWRERTATCLWRLSGTRDYPWPWKARDPKRVTFTVHGRSRFDSDNVALVCSPCRDALQDMKIIDNDGNVAHRFLYEQAPPSRKAGSAYGIAIRIALAGGQGGAG